MDARRKRQVTGDGEKRIKIIIMIKSLLIVNRAGESTSYCRIAGLPNCPNQGVSGVVEYYSADYQ